jgi:NitT/TauT family transport system substrate-binding protein
MNKKGITTMFKFRVTTAASLAALITSPFFAMTAEAPTR